MFVQSTNQWRI